MVTKIAHLPAVAMFVCILAAHSPAQAETTNCVQITDVPVTISSSGTYCLVRHLVYMPSSGDAITVNAGNVVVDFNGFSISNRHTGNTTLAYGVVFTNRPNITIRNGSIIGFNSGIRIESDRPGLLIEDMRLAENRNVGILARFFRAADAGGIIRRCQIDKTGGTSAALGIAVTGGSVEIVQNRVVGAVGTLPGTGVGILAMDGTHTVVDNRVHLADVGIRMSFDITPYRDNIVTGVRFAYEGGTPVGTTNVP